MIFRKAILIIHGFAGGCYDNEYLANYLELNRWFDVYQFTLPGHDKNLSKSTYKEWIYKSENTIKWLISNGYKTIYLIGHSMGGVIASYLASKYKQIKKLVLLAPAFHYLNVIDNKVDIKSTLKLLPKVLEEYNKDEVIGRFLKLNVTALGELMKLVKEFYNTPKDINCSVLIIHGENDNLVPKSSVEYVYDCLKNNKKLVYMKDVNHDICRSKRKKTVLKIVQDFLVHNIKGGIEHI